MYPTTNFINFIRESNRIEGIYRDPSHAEIGAHVTFLDLKEIKVTDLERFVSVVQPNAILRRKRGLNVRVGNHIAPAGGPEIENALNIILDDQGSDTPFNLHHRYEILHPFTDGNGRSGRALWLWMMQDCDLIHQALEIGFLHNWYYQSLSAGRLE